MREAAYVIGFNVAVTCAFARVAGILVGALRSLTLRRRFEVVYTGWVEAITWVEPPLLALVTYVLLVQRQTPGSASGAEAGAAVAGALVASTGLALALWALFSWRQLFVGHGVLEEQELVTDGAFGLVRHPVYLAALLIWAGLGLCFLSAPAAGIALAYVLPAYLLYIRAEEAMMLESFGERYRRYRRAVPMLVPRLRGPHA